jgi:hypothetical protein
MPIKWTPELVQVLREYRIVEQRSAPNMVQLTGAERVPNDLLQGLVDLVNAALKPGQVASDIAVYQRYKKEWGQGPPAAPEPPVKPAVEPAQTAVKPAKKRTREDERAKARAERLAFENTVGGFKICAWTNEEREVVRQWRNAHPHDTSKCGSLSDDLVTLGERMKRTPDAILRRLPAAQTEGESAGEVYAKSGTPFSEADEQLVRTWAQNNPTDLAGRGSRSPAFMELVNQMQRHPRGISGMVMDYRRETPAVSETRANTGGKTLPRKPAQKATTSSSSSSDEDENDRPSKRPTTGGKEMPPLEADRVESEEKCAPQAGYSKWTEEQLQACKQWKVDNPAYCQSRKYHGDAFQAFADSLKRTARSVWDHTYGAKEKNKVPQKAQVDMNMVDVPPVAVPEVPKVPEVPVANLNATDEDQQAAVRIATMEATYSKSMAELNTRLMELEVPAVPAAVAVLPVDADDPNVEWWMTTAGHRSRSMTPSSPPDIDKQKQELADLYQQMANLRALQARVPSPSNEQQQEDAADDSGSDGASDTTQDLADYHQAPQLSRSGVVVYPSTARVMSPSNGAAAGPASARVMSPSNGAAAGHASAPDGLLPAEAMTTALVASHFGVHDVLPIYAVKLQATLGALKKLRDTGAIKLFTGEEVSILGVSRIEVVDQKQWNVEMTASAKSYSPEFFKDRVTYNNTLYNLFNSLGFRAPQKDEIYWGLNGRPKVHIMFDWFEYSQAAFVSKEGRYIGFNHGKTKK